MKKAITLARGNNTASAAVTVDPSNQFITAFNTTKLDKASAQAEINVIHRLEDLAYENAGDLTSYTSAELCFKCMSASA